MRPIICNDRFVTRADKIISSKIIAPINEDLYTRDDTMLDHWRGGAGVKLDVPDEVFDALGTYHAHISRGCVWVLSPDVVVCFPSRIKKELTVHREYMGGFITAHMLGYYSVDVGTHIIHEKPREMPLEISVFADKRNSLSRVLSRRDALILSDKDMRNSVHRMGGDVKYSGRSLDDELQAVYSVPTVLMVGRTSDMVEFRNVYGWFLGIKFDDRTMYVKGEM